MYGVKAIPAQFVIGVIGPEGKFEATLTGCQPSGLKLEAALARAGIRVEVAVLKKAEEQISQRKKAR